jgi:hypothetical protein
LLRKADLLKSFCNFHLEKVILHLPAQSCHMRAACWKRLQALWHAVKIAGHFGLLDGGESLLAHRNGACRVKTAPPEIFLLKPEILLL